MKKSMETNSQEELDILSPRLSDESLGAMSSLGLAHIGDAVYELMVRSWLCARGSFTTSKALHRRSVMLVRAGAQARAGARILPELTPNELSVFRRGRNARVNSVPSGAEISEYHSATALEALFGWLYLKGDKDRLNELFKMIMEGFPEY